MPTNRRRVRRTPRPSGLSPSEIQWLTGRPQEGANVFWQHVRGHDKVVRCRRLIAENGELIPPGRLPALIEDLKHWDRPFEAIEGGNGQ